LELNPTTEKILSESCRIIQEICSLCNESDAKILLLKAIRCEEIRQQKFYTDFHQLPKKERIKTWKTIIQNIKDYIPDKKARKKVIKECMKCLDKYLQ